MPSEIALSTVGTPRLNVANLAPKLTASLAVTFSSPLLNTLPSLEPPSPANSYNAPTPALLPLSFNVVAKVSSAPAPLFSASPYPFAAPAIACSLTKAPVTAFPIAAKLPVPENKFLPPVIAANAKSGAKLVMPPTTSPPIVSGNLPVVCCNSCSLNFTSLMPFIAFPKKSEYGIFLPYSVNSPFSYIFSGFLPIIGILPDKFLKNSKDAASISAAFSTAFCLKF